MFRSLDKGQSTPPCLPPMSVGLLLRALLKRRHARGATPLRPLSSEFLADVASGTDIAAYNAVLGFAPGRTPLTCYYLLVQRAHMVTMLAPAFPHRIVGMVHVENALVLHGAHAPGPIRLSTRIELLPPTTSGAVYCALETEGRCGDALAFTCTSKYLAVRGKRRAGPAAAEAEVAPGAAVARWTLPPSAGRAYARVSGDWNPIHLAGWSARLMGLREPIIHGMHSVGKACAHLEAASGRRVCAISVRFRSPIPLGASVVLAEGPQPHTYALYCNGALAAQGGFELDGLA